jgi:thiaminase
MNTNASRFVDTLTRKFSSIVDKILRHPYLLSVESKKLSREDLKVFVCEQYHIISNDKRNFALVESRTSNSLSATLFRECLSFESIALDNLSLLANELSLDTSQLKSYEPHAEASSLVKTRRLSSSVSTSIVNLQSLISLKI